MTVVKVFGRVHRVACAEPGCGFVDKRGLTQAQAEELDRQHTQGHGLEREVVAICEQAGWTPRAPIEVQVWDSLVREHDGALGMTYFADRLIAIDKRWLTGALDDTLRHEVAHMMAWDLLGDSSHGEGWQKCAVLCGAEPEARKHISLELAAQVGYKQSRRGWR